MPDSSLACRGELRRIIQGQDFVRRDKREPLTILGGRQADGGRAGARSGYRVGGRCGNGLAALWRLTIATPTVVVAARACDRLRRGGVRRPGVGCQRRNEVDRQHRAGRDPSVHVDDSGAHLAEHPLAFGRRWQLLDPGEQLPQAP